MVKGGGGGHKRFWSSLNVGAYSFSHTEKCSFSFFNK